MDHPSGSTAKGRQSQGEGTRNSWNLRESRAKPDVHDLCMATKGERFILDLENVPKMYQWSKEIHVRGREKGICAGEYKEGIMGELKTDLGVPCVQAEDGGNQNEIQAPSTPGLLGAGRNKGKTSPDDLSDPHCGQQDSESEVPWEKEGNTGHLHHFLGFCLRLNRKSPFSPI